MNHISTIVTLQDAVGEFTSLLKVPSEERDPEWPHMMCRLSRRIHIGVWDEAPEPEQVGVIIELLAKAQDEMRALDMGVYHEDEAQRINRHTRNIGWRLKNIKDNYLEGKLSAFAPDHTLED